MWRFNKCGIVSTAAVILYAGGTVRVRSKNFPILLIQWKAPERHWWSTGMATAVYTWNHMFHAKKVKARKIVLTWGIEVIVGSRLPETDGSRVKYDSKCGLDLAGGRVTCSEGEGDDLGGRSNQYVYLLRVIIYWSFGKKHTKAHMHSVPRTEDLRCET